MSSPESDTQQIDLALVEHLTKQETAALDEKHARSLTYREEAAARRRLVVVADLAAPPDLRRSR